MPAMAIQIGTPIGTILCLQKVEEEHKAHAAENLTLDMHVLKNEINLVFEAPEVVEEVHEAIGCWEEFEKPFWT